MATALSRLVSSPCWRRRPLSPHTHDGWLLAPSRTSYSSQGQAKLPEREDAVEHVIVERTMAEPISIEQLHQSSCSAKGCFELFRVIHLRSTISVDGLRVICEFTAPDAESVRRAQLKANLPYEQIYTAKVYENR